MTNLKAVYAEAAKDKEGYAGGFVGRSHTGGLAGLAQEDKDGALKLPGIVNVSGLLDLVPYLIPQYTNTTVTFCSAMKNLRSRLIMPADFLEKCKAVRS